MDRIKELIDLAMRVNEETEHDLFVRLSPHIKGIEIDIHCFGWRVNSDYDISLRYNYGREECVIHDEEDVYGRDVEYKDFINILNGMLKGGTDV